MDDKNLHSVSREILNVRCMSNNPSSSIFRIWRVVFLLSDVPPFMRSRCITAYKKKRQGNRQFNTWILVIKWLIFCFFVFTVLIRRNTVFCLKQFSKITGTAEPAGGKYLSDILRGVAKHICSLWYPILIYIFNRRHIGKGFKAVKTLTSADVGKLQ